MTLYHVYLSIFKNKYVYNWRSIRLVTMFLWFYLWLLQGKVKNKTICDVIFILCKFMLGVNAWLFTNVCICICKSLMYYYCVTWLPLKIIIIWTLESESYMCMGKGRLLNVAARRECHPKHQQQRLEQKVILYWRSEN